MWQLVGGLQPSLSIGYSSGGSNGWMGEGWDVQGVSAITIDTRWGAPQFDGLLRQNCIQWMEKCWCILTIIFPTDIMM
ncbi:SpvB/TcaC N-terminal domain-containing protein [Chryseobacterium sp. Leaf405]|uniref:SpvB/TcaC N-terminal domain-containing protein n=1 Tax=Chryseobacterium sp. Leaf405 TaxID=1736367 RepID=UPI000E439C58|nr:SpvB/TcaC N-terminal domain-containing protein [Chryseobacterium sp. Leaf405]